MAQGLEKRWEYLGQHAANTCVVGPGNIFDGHASSNLSAFWAILGAAQSDRPEELRAYLDYMKTFIILSEAHNGGLIIQPWGRDQSIPRLGSTVTREVPDVLELILTFGGGTLAIKREGQVVARIEHVPFLGKRMKSIERLLGVTRVKHTN